MPGNSAFLLAAAIGFVAGLRSLTAPAAVSWAARVGWIDLDGTVLSFMGSMPAVVGFSVLALGEFAADLHPTTPSRTRPGPLIARILMGALSGASLCAAVDRSLLAGALLGGLGGLTGAFAGYQARTRLVSALRVKDRVIGLSEDFIALVLAWCIMFLAMLARVQVTTT
jgi:uncharacterized membrane protein